MASVKSILPNCGLYKTTKPLPEHEAEVAAGALVYFHNHSDSGLPVVIVPEHNVPHFSKLFDVRMMCWGTGQERTEAQYLSLLERAGWKPTGSYYPENRQMGVITGVRA